MLHHAHQVLSVANHSTTLPVYDFNVTMNTFKTHQNNVDEHKAALICPNDSDFFLLFVAADKSVYAQPANESSINYSVQSQWNFLSCILPPDSVVKAIVYNDHTNTIQMGLFDMLRCDGVNCTNKDILSRHALLHTTYYNSSPDVTGTVKMHWVGFESVCLQYLLHNKELLPFSANSVLRVQDSTCVKILTPIPIFPASILTKRPLEET